jgi:hypothetical protein
MSPSFEAISQDTTVRLSTFFVVVLSYSSIQSAPTLYVSEDELNILPMRIQMLFMGEHIRGYPAIRDAVETLLNVASVHMPIARAILMFRGADAQNLIDALQTVRVFFIRHFQCG